MVRFFLFGSLIVSACSAPSGVSTPAKVEGAGSAKPHSSTIVAIAANSTTLVPTAPVCPPCLMPTITCSRGVCVAPTTMTSGFPIAVHFSNATTRNVIDDALGPERSRDALEFTSYSDINCHLFSTGVIRCHDEPTKPLVDVPGIEDATHIAMHSSSVCASRARGDIACNGATGLYRITKEPTVILDKLPAKVVQMVATDGHTCAKLENGTVLCWGQNGYGQCGTKKYEVDSSGLLFVREPTLVADLDNVVDVALTPQSSCAALSNGSAVCWGNAIGNVINDRNASNAMLQGSKTRADQQALATTPRSWFFKNVFRKPQRIEGLKDVTRLVFGLRRLWLLRKDGNVESVDIADLQSKHPRIETLAGVTNVVQLAAGAQDLCALTSNSEIYCWKETDLASSQPSTVVVRKIRIESSN